MEEHSESGAGQLAAQIGDTPAPGSLAEINAQLRELVVAVVEIGDEVKHRVRSGGHPPRPVDPYVLTTDPNSTVGLLGQLVHSVREIAADKRYVRQRCEKPPPTPEEIAERDRELRELIRAQVWRPKDA